MRAYGTVLFAAFAAFGCSEEMMAAGRGAATAPSGAAAGADCTLSNLTQACTCSTGWAGSQTCASGTWTACNCRAPAAASGSVSGGSGTAVGPEANRSSARFDWQRTTPSLGSCEAGHYEGVFTGIYGPSIIVVADLKVIPVFPVDLPGSPGLAFDLARQGQGEVFTVSNGRMNGNALGAFPFTADIVGSLDCETLTFDAKLVNGSYFIGPLEYKFEGPLLASYNKESHSFVAGTWNVMEPAYPGAGGGGDWSASWKHN